jgi:hypothetical protein
VEALKTNEDTPDVSDMMAFHDQLVATSDDTFVSDFAGVLDMTKLAKYLAVDRVLSNDDGMSTFYCYGQGVTECTNANFYWYGNPDGQMELIPWDLDYALYDISEDLGRAQQDPNPNNCEPIPACEVWQTPDCDPATEQVFILPPQCDKLYGLIHRATWSNEYMAELENLADGPLAADVIGPWVHAVRRKIEDTVAADPLGPDILKWQQANSWLDQVLESDLAEVRQLLAEQ